jgi:hypothetical protein
VTTDNHPTDPTPSPATAPAPQPQSGARPCFCGEFRDQDGNGTGCTRTTKAKWAQGCDAAAAAWLARAEAAGQQVRHGDGPLMSAVAAAKVAGLHYDVAARAARLSARNTRKRKQPAEPQPVTATIKRGRWVIENATIAPSGDAAYQTKDGETRTAPAGSYKVLATVGGAV